MEKRSLNKSFHSEREGQIKFFDKFAIANTELTNNTDGVYNGTIFDIYLHIGSWKLEIVT